MIKTVGLELKWLPRDIGGLFCDGADHNGIVYWYDEIVGLVKRMTPAKPVNGK